MDMSTLLNFMVRQGASDLHLAAGQPPMLRIDGDIRRVRLPPLQAGALKALLYGVLTQQERHSLEQDKELDFAYQLADSARFRINAFHTSTGLAAAIRHVPQQLPSLQQLAAPEVLPSLLAERNGLILVTGPTGSGKSTTLAAMLDHLNQHYPYHLITIEDPIEFVHGSRRALVNQRELNRHTMGYGAALRAALREDPDVILVGELRDLETIRMALTAAETGHLVLATLHTCTAAKSINRIVDVFPAGEKPLIRSLLSDCLRAVLAQRLVRARGGGRRAVFEVLLNTPAVRNLIREDKLAQIYSLMQSGAGQGMHTMEQALQGLIAAGEVEQQGLPGGMATRG